MARLILVTLAVALCISTAAALKCYRCIPDVATSGGCADNFDNSSSAVATIECTGSSGCLKSRAKASSTVVIVRGCSPAGLTNTCVDVSLNGASSRTCSCYTDYCNGATAAAISGPAFLSALFLGVSAFFLQF